MNELTNHSAFEQSTSIEKPIPDNINGIKQHKRKIFEPFKKFRNKVIGAVLLGAASAITPTTEPFAQTPQDITDITSPQPRETATQELKEPVGYASPDSVKKLFEWFKSTNKRLQPDITIIPGSATPDAQEEISKIIRDQNPIYLFQYIGYLKDIVPNLGKELSYARDVSPSYFLLFAKNFQGIKDYDLAKDIAESSKDDPAEFLRSYRVFKNLKKLNHAELIMKAKSKAPEEFIKNINEFTDEIPVHELKKSIEEVREIDPWPIIFNAAKIRPFYSESQWQVFVEKTFEIYPYAYMLKSQESVKNFLSYIKEAQSESFKRLKSLNEPRTAILLNDMVRHDLTEQEAVSIIRNSSEYFKRVVRIKSEKDHLGKISVDEFLKDESLDIVFNINELHDQPDSIRFNSVNKLSAAETYTVMVYGEEEIYTSSFNGIFDRLLQKMKHENLSGKQLLENVGENKFRTFIKECAGFNRLNEFLQTMDTESANSLLVNIVKNLEQTPDKLAQATTVADIFSMITDTDMLRVLQRQIKQEYDRVSVTPGAKKEDQIIYGTLSGMFGEKAVVNEAWLKEMSEKFKLPNISQIKSSDLFNVDSINTQQYFFYNDKDGKASFDSFLRQYQNRSGWNIEKKDSYVHIVSERNGKKLEIYANYPNSEDDGPEEIEKILKDKNINTLVVVHRGHSYHAQKTIERIPSIARIVSLGSCGGYNNIEKVLSRAPLSHIISTKGTGTMLVNDPLFISLNELILSGTDINWQNYWENARKQLGNNPNFLDYVPPHKNLGVMFLKAINQQLQHKE